MLLPGGSPATAAALSAAAAAAAGEGNRVFSGRTKNNRAEALSRANSENERNSDMRRADNSSTKPSSTKPSPINTSSKHEPRREMKSMRLDGYKEMELVWREQALRHALDHAPLLPVLYPRATACTVERAIAVATAWRDAGIRSMQVNCRLHAPICGAKLIPFRPPCRSAFQAVGQRATAAVHIPRTLYQK